MLLLHLTMCQKQSISLRHISPMIDILKTISKQGEKMIPKNRCPLCKGELHLSTTTFTVDLGENLIVIRNTPATVCRQCGESWIEDSVAENIEMIVNEAKEKHRMIEVLDFALESVA